MFSRDVFCRGGIPTKKIAFLSTDLGGLSYETMDRCGARGMRHEVEMVDFPSGLRGIVIDAGGPLGGFDPRREGLVLSD